MRTSVPGSFEASGFTLIEILVVVVLIAIATAASLTALRPPSADPAREGRRLAGILERLALEARLSGQRTAWHCTGNRLQFETWGSAKVTAQGAWQPWTTLPETLLAEPLRFGSLTMNERTLDCSKRIVFPVFGNAPEFSLEILGADPDVPVRHIGGDAAGRVVLLEVAAN